MLLYRRFEAVDILCASDCMRVVQCSDGEWRSHVFMKLHSRCTQQTSNTSFPDNASLSIYSKLKRASTCCIPISMHLSVCFLSSLCCVIVSPSCMLLMSPVCEEEDLELSND